MPALRAFQAFDAALAIDFGADVQIGWADGRALPTICTTVLDF